MKKERREREKSKQWKENANEKLGAVNIGLHSCESKDGSTLPKSIPFHLYNSRIVRRNVFFYCFLKIGLFLTLYCRLSYRNYSTHNPYIKSFNPRHLKWICST